MIIHYDQEGHFINMSNALVIITYSKDATLIERQCKP